MYHIVSLTSMEITQPLIIERGKGGQRRVGVSEKECDRNKPCSLEPKCCGIFAQHTAQAVVLRMPIRRKPHSGQVEIRGGKIYVLDESMGRIYKAAAKGVTSISYTSLRGNYRMDDPPVVRRPSLLSSHLPSIALILRG